MSRQRERSQIAQQLAAVEQRLLSRYRDRANIAEDQVREVVTTFKSRLADSRVLSFLPILVERGAVRELERLCNEHAGDDAAEDAESADVAGRAPHERS
jgi:hypothetical protein